MKPTHKLKPEFGLELDYYLTNGVWYVKDHKGDLQIASLNDYFDPYELVEEIE